MNILILNWRDSSHPKSGGAEHVTMEHAKGWVRAGHSVTWFTGGYRGAPRENEIQGVHFVRRAGSLTVYLYAPLYLIANGHTFEVIIDEAHGFPFFAPLFTRTPVILFIHEIAGEIWDYMFPFPKNVIGKLLERLYFSLYRRNLFWTDAPSTELELVGRGIPKVQCIVIPCPIIRPLKGSGKKESLPTFLFVSRVVRMKGIEEVIKAFSFILKEEKRARLWIVGGGEHAYVRELKNMLEEYGEKGRVKLFGNVTDKKKFELMTRAHILLHASVKEGWGLVVLEAASAGTPAVVYNVSGLKDTVVNGKTGIVLKENSPVEMAKEALVLYRDTTRYRAFQKNAKKRASDFHWSDSVAMSLALLSRVARR